MAQRGTSTIAQNAGHGTQIQITKTILILQSGFLLTLRTGHRQKCHEDGNWTCKVQFYERCGQTGRDLLQEALGSFLETLYEASNPDGEEQVANRVAIVGYGMGASYINTDGKREPGVR